MPRRCGFECHACAEQRAAHVIRCTEGLCAANKAMLCSMAALENASTRPPPHPQGPCNRSTSPADITSMAAQRAAPDPKQDASRRQRPSRRRSCPLSSRAVPLEQLI